MKKANRISLLLIALSLLVSYAYFYQAGGWNQNSHYALVRSIVEQNTLRIDSYHKSTGDKALVDGHYYSDKAPGVSLAAVPVVAMSRPFVSDPNSSDGVATLSYIATVFVSGLPVMLAALLLFGLARRFGASVGGAAFTAIVFGLGTPAWCYATLFFGHALALGCLVAALAGALALRDRNEVRRDWLLAVGVGLAGGCATVTEYTAVVPAALLAGLALQVVWPDRERRLRVALGAAAGAAIMVVVLLVYNTAAFGGPFEVSYSGVQGFDGMKQGFMGIGAPKLSVLGEILVGRFRGLLPLAPVLALAPVGAYFMIRNRDTRTVSLIVAAIAGYYILLNASYFYWNGGWSYGPRHMAAALPFLCFFLGPLWSRGRFLRIVLAGCALYGVGISLVAVSTTAQAPEHIRRPMSELLWPAFVDGDLSLNHQSFVESGANPRLLRGGRVPHDAWNLGERFGLSGHLSLVPLYLVWAGCLAGWFVFVYRRRSADGS